MSQIIELKYPSDEFPKMWRAAIKEVRNFDVHVKIEEYKENSIIGIIDGTFKNKEVKYNYFVWIICPSQYWCILSVRPETN